MQLLKFKEAVGETMCGDDATSHATRHLSSSSGSSASTSASAPINDASITVPFTIPSADAGKSLPPRLLLPRNDAMAVKTPKLLYAYWCAWDGWCCII